MDELTHDEQVMRKWVLRKFYPRGEEVWEEIQRRRKIEDIVHVSAVEPVYFDGPIVSLRAIRDRENYADLFDFKYEVLGRTLEVRAVPKGEGTPADPSYPEEMEDTLFND